MYPRYIYTVLQMSLESVDVETMFRKVENDDSHYIFHTRAKGSGSCFVFKVNDYKKRVEVLGHTDENQVGSSVSVSVYVVRKSFVPFPL